MRAGGAVCGDDPGPTTSEVSGWDFGTLKTHTIVGGAQLIPDQKFVVNTVKVARDDDGNMTNVPILEHAVPAKPVCGFKAYNDQDGEDYTCGLPPHGPKIKHGSWVRV